MIKFVASDKDIYMKAVPEFWLTIQNGYIILNWRAVTGRYMCHHLMLCKVWQVEAIRKLSYQLSELADQIDA